MKKFQEAEKKELCFNCGKKQKVYRMFEVKQELIEKKICKHCGEITF